MKGKSISSFLFWNIKGFKVKDKKKLIDQIIAPYDFVNLSETHLENREDHTSLQQEYEKEWETVWSYKNGKSAGVAILIKRSFLQNHGFKIHRHTIDEEGRFVWIQVIGWPSGPLNLVAIYAPCEKEKGVKEKWWTDLEETLEEVEGPIVLGGDLNLV
jgi:exonuclease III